MTTRKKSPKRNTHAWRERVKKDPMTLPIRPKRLKKPVREVPISLGGLRDEVVVQMLPPLRFSDSGSAVEPSTLLALMLYDSAGKALAIVRLPLVTRRSHHEIIAMVSMVPGPMVPP